MVELSPEISLAYEEIRNNKSESDWILIEYDPSNNQRLVLSCQGSGGLEKFRDSLKAGQPAFGYLRIKIGSGSDIRNKFVLISWCDQEVKISQRGRIFSDLPHLKKTIKSFALELSVSDRFDLQEADIVKSLKKAMGSNYDTL